MAFDGDACRVDDDSGAVGCFGPVEGVGGYLDVAADSPSKRLVRPKKRAAKYDCKTQYCSQYCSGQGCISLITTGNAHTHKEAAAHRLALRERVDLLQI